METEMRRRDVCFVVMPFLILFLVWVFSSFAVDLEDADALGCNDGIINMGDSKSDVVKKCGEPTRKEGFQEYLWIYDFGSSKLVYYLTFSRDRLERIQTGGYGD
jgi:hypothetical protein